MEPRKALALLSEFRTGTTRSAATDTSLFGARQFDNSVAVFDAATNTVVATIMTGVSVSGLGIDTQTGTTYVSDFVTRGRLFAIEPDGKVSIIEVSQLRPGFGVPGQVEVDERSSRIYVISSNSSGGSGGIPPLIALDRTTRALVATLKPEEWVFGSPQALAIDERRNLLYVAASSDSTNRVLVFDGTKLSEDTRVSAALLANITVGREDNTELAQGIAVDAEGRVSPNPAQAILGVIPIKLLPAANIPVVADYSSRELAFNPEQGLLYGVTKSSAPFREGFISVINSALVIDANRKFIDTPHRDVSGALNSLIATLPAGIDPEFIVVDPSPSRNRVAVTNQSLGALSVLQGLSIR
ncbi:MAG: hypothetical protein HYZ81_06210 [Nitrospinae bacterium]|nr:hypothetical protein [Nitrospinota bacterium]